MEKKQLFSIVTTKLTPLGFKHWKPSAWKRLGAEVSDCIYLQRSLYGRFYYFRYGCIINNLPLPSGVFFHTFGKIDISTATYQKIQNILDLENNISDGERKKKLEYYLQLTVPKVNPLETEKDLKDFLIRNQLLISADVMKYLNLE